MIIARREHEFCYGHRVVGHEGKCKLLHGHNAKVVFYIGAEALDIVGRVIDFSVIKDTMCQWLEDNWDHKFLMWDIDELINQSSGEGDGLFYPVAPLLKNIGVVRVPFNPTAENLADHLLRVVGPNVLLGTSVKLIKVEFYETSKCSVVVEI